MDKHRFPNGKRLVRGTLKPDDNLHYEKFSDGSVKLCDFESDYEIPNNWVWCNLGLLFNHNTGKALNAANSEGKTLTYITTSNVYWNRFELNDLKLMPFTDSEIEKGIKDMSSIIEFVNQINAIDYALETKTKPLYITNAFREDDIKESFSRESILSNVQGGENGFFFLKRSK